MKDELSLPTLKPALWSTASSSGLGRYATDLYRRYCKDVALLGPSWKAGVLCFSCEYISFFRAAESSSCFFRSTITNDTLSLQL